MSSSAANRDDTGFDLTGVRRFRAIEDKLSSILTVVNFSDIDRLFRFVIHVTPGACTAYKIGEIG